MRRTTHLLRLAMVCVLLPQACGLLTGCYAGAVGMVLGALALAGNDKGKGSVDLPPVVRDLAVRPLQCRDRIEIQFKVANEDEGSLDVKIEFVHSDRGGEALAERGGEWRDATLEEGSSFIDGVATDQLVRRTWDARRDLGDSFEMVQVRVTPFEDDKAAASVVTLEFPAGNTPIAMTKDVELFSRGDVVLASFEVADAESDPAILERLEVEIHGSGYQEFPLDLLKTVRRDYVTAPNGASGNFSFPITDLAVLPALKEAGDPGFVGEIALRLWMRDFDCETLEPTEGRGRFDNNEPPRIVLLPIGDATIGVVPLRFNLTDQDNRKDLTRKDLANVEVKLDSGNGKFDWAADELPLAASRTTDLESDDATLEASELKAFTFLWDAVSQLRDRDTAGGVTLKLIASDYERDEVELHLNLSFGLLRRAGETDVGELPQALASADFDGDGFADLAVANRTSGDVSLLKGGPEGLPRSESARIRLGAEGAQGQGPSALASGDFNQDGSPDLVTANSFSHDASLLQGDTDGLRWVRNLSTGRNPVALLAGDFNADGVSDAVVANKVSGNVTFFTGFTGIHGRPSGLERVEPAEIPTDNEPVALSPVDFDGDGILDVAVACRSGRSVWILKWILKGGLGGLEPLARIPLPEPPLDMASGDLDGDRAPELAVLVRGIPVDHVVILRPGSPSELRKIPVGKFATVLLSADFHRDGYADVAVANSNSDSISILRGGPTIPQSTEDMPAGARPYALTSGDYDGDGFPELLVSNFSSSQVTLFKGGSQGLQRSAELQTGRQPAALASGDFDGDGILDAAVANELSNDVTSLRGGIDILKKVGDLGTGDKPMAFASGDYDGDAFPDLLVANFGSKTATYCRGGATGLKAVDQLKTEDAPTSVASGDFDNDGRLDAVIANNGSRSVTILGGSREGLKEKGGFEITCPPSSSAPRAVLSGDFNGDGVDDAVVSTRANCVAFLPGEPDQGLLKATFTTARTGDQSEALASADFNGDALLDVLVANRGSESTTELHGHRELGLDRRADIALGGAPSTLASGDFDGDGSSDDAIVANDSLGVVHFLRGGSEGLELGGETRVGLQPTRLTSGDFDGDGFVDALVGNSGSKDVTYLPGRPGGLVRQEPAEIPLAGAPSAMLAGDFDGDGFLDALVAKDAEDSVTLLRGSASGLSRAREIPLQAGDDPKAIVAEDFDGDGFLEVAVANCGSDSIAYFRQVYAVPHANRLVESPSSPVELLDPRFPPRYRLEIPGDALDAPTQVCVIPCAAFALPSTGICIPGAYLRIAADPVAILRESVELRSPATLTVALRDARLADSPGKLWILRQGTGSPGEAVPCSQGIRIVDFGWCLRTAMAPWPGR